MSPQTPSAKLWARRLLERVGYDVVKVQRGSASSLDRLSLVRTIGNFLDIHEIDCVIDVGANRGQFARLLRDEASFTGRIVSFEPGSAAFADLARSRRGDQKWQGHQVALGSANETAALRIFREDNFSSFLAPSTYGAGRFPTLGAAAETERVPVRRLDDGWEDYAQGSRSVFVKLDTQGRDLQVLEGAVDILSDVRGVLTEIPVREIYDSMTPFTATIDVLMKKGFEPCGFWPVTFEKDLRAIEFDCILARVDDR